MTLWIQIYLLNKFTHNKLIIMQIIFFKVLIINFLISQNLFWPTDGKKNFSSNFGEYRNGLFHLGLDVKTDGIVGKKVFAIDDGYIHRMRSDYTGYGKALYQTTLSGHEVVYAHLKSFTPLMNKVWRLQQAKRKSYKVDAHFSTREFQVKKGDLIGYSGNTGNSFAPHLHLEIRSSKSEPLNPLTMGFKNLPDNVMPIPKELAIIPLSIKSIINASQLSQTIPLFRDRSGIYHFADSISVFGEFGLALKAVDKREGANNIYQFNRAELKVNNELKFSLEYSKIPFSENKFAKEIVQYNLLRNNLGEFQKLYRAKEQKQISIHNTKTNGIINLPPGTHNIEIIIYDAANNKAIIKGTVVGTFPTSINAEEIFRDENIITLALTPSRGSIPLKDVILYNFTPFGFVDKKVNIIEKSQVKDNLHVTFSSNDSKNRIIQIIGINKFGGMVQPSHWTNMSSTKSILEINPSLKISSSKEGVLFQIDLDKYIKTRAILKLANDNTFTSYKMNQVRPNAYITEKLDHDVVKDMDHVLVELYSNEKIKETRFHYQLKAIESKEETSIFSNDRNCIIHTKTGSLFQKNVLWIDKVKKFAEVKDGFHLSPVYQLQPYDLALKGKIEVQLKYNENLREHSNLGIYYYNQKNSDWEYLKTERLRNRFILSAELTDMEAITIIQDLSPPKIIKAFPENGGRYLSRDIKRIQINIDDKISGIEPKEKSFKLKFNGNDLYPAYQPIKKVVSYDFDNNLSAGQHKIEFTVKDRMSNELSKVIHFVVIRD